LARERISTVVVKQKTMSASSSSVTGAPHASDDHQRSSSSKQDSNLTTGGRSGKLPAHLGYGAILAARKPLRKGSVAEDSSWERRVSTAPVPQYASRASEQHHTEAGEEVLGRLRPNGELQWSDGDVWTRDIVSPAAESNSNDGVEDGAATDVAALEPERSTCIIMADMSAKDFRELAGPCGPKSPCHISLSGFGHVEFQTNDGEEAALVMLNGHDNMKISLGSDDAEVSHCDAPEPPSSLQAEFKAGASVRIYGLINAKHFNGVRATCESFDDISGAWSVKLTTGETKKLMPDNLQLVVPSELRARFTELTRELIEAEKTLPSSIRAMAPGTPPRQKSDEAIKKPQLRAVPKRSQSQGIPKLAWPQASTPKGSAMGSWRPGSAPAWRPVAKPVASPRGSVLAYKKAVQEPSSSSGARGDALEPTADQRRWKAETKNEDSDDDWGADWKASDVKAEPSSGSVTPCISDAPSLVNLRDAKGKRIYGPKQIKKRHEKQKEGRKTHRASKKILLAASVVGVVATLSNDPLIFLACVVPCRALPLLFLACAMPCKAMPLPIMDFGQQPFTFYDWVADKICSQVFKTTCSSILDLLAPHKQETMDMRTPAGASVSVPAAEWDGWVGLGLSVVLSFLVCCISYATYRVTRLLNAISIALSQLVAQVPLPQPVEALATCASSVARSLRRSMSGVLRGPSDVLRGRADVPDLEAGIQQGLRRRHRGRMADRVETFSIHSEDEADEQRDDDVLSHSVDLCDQLPDALEVVDLVDSPVRGTECRMHVHEEPPRYQVGPSARSPLDHVAVVTSGVIASDLLDQGNILAECAFDFETIDEPIMGEVVGFV